MRELLSAHWTKGSCLRGATCLRYSIKMMKIFPCPNMYIFFFRRGLTVLKTTQSAFVDFVDDEYRSLPDMHERYLSVYMYLSIYL